MSGMENILKIRVNFCLHATLSNIATCSNHCVCRGDQSNMSLDSSMTLLDNTVNSAAGSGVWSRSSMDRSTLLEALKQERETRPESFWRV